MPDHRSALATSHSYLGLLLATMGKLAEAEEQSRKGQAIYEKLAAEFPALPDYRSGLARATTSRESCWRALESGRKRRSSTARASPSMRRWRPTSPPSGLPLRPGREPQHPRKSASGPW